MCVIYFTEIELPVLLITLRDVLFCFCDCTDAYHLHESLQSELRLVFLVFVNVHDHNYLCFVVAKSENEQNIMKFTFL